MPKKNWTPEEKKAFGERMKQARASKVDTVVNEPGVEELRKQVEELKQLINQGNTGNQLGVNQRGGLVGTFEKYVVDPRAYPDPRERLAAEPRLARFAFPQNYELGWDVSTTSYTTIDGVRTREPKFTLELNVIMRDEDTGEPTSGRYTIRRAVFHEDPQAAMVVARENGLEVDETNEKKFLDEMRYIRMRDWLLEAFYPPKTDTKRAKKEMVVGNRVVEYFEVSSPDSEKMSWDLKGKV